MVASRWGWSEQRAADAPNLEAPLVRFVFASGGTLPNDMYKDRVASVVRRCSRRDHSRQREGERRAHPEPMDTDKVSFGARFCATGSAVERDSTPPSQRRVE